ncbi:MAG: hypothetical protein JSU86_16640 [Phycisphaerales bacterium]|nr:MAG: hypothetical protein JSU86_16640 [Phycisphaerales bacterium]
MAQSDNFTISRRWLYLAMVVLLVAIFIGASRGAPPIYLAVGFIGEIILVATVHLSAVIQQYSTRPLGDRHGL